MKVKDKMYGKIEIMPGSIAGDKKTEHKPKSRQTTPDAKYNIQRMTDKLHQGM